MINLAKSLIESTAEYNGHKQNVLSHLSHEDLLQLLKDLAQYTRENYHGKSELFALCYYGPDDYLIEQKDYWKVGEHLLGHTDRIILSSD